MSSLVLVTGGTGTLGRRVVDRLQRAGRPVRVLSRHAPAEGRGSGVEHVIGDLSGGSGVVAALDGVGTVVHCAGSATGDEAKTQQLVRAATDAGGPHLVLISVVGADRLPVETAVDRALFGYFAAKGRAERVVAESGLPWSTVRATQFHQSLLAMVRTMTRMPIVPVPAGWRFQPVDAGEVADRLVELALGPPAGLVPDVAGPEVHAMTDLLRGYLAATGRRRPLLPVPLPG
ncbi:SDR family oxidoreductase, partial [Ornithinicoccus halotolerans]|uniref:SDR family oxidoreductase n=1 Tax=Ornithinicoccus halotolerans TaxID=1748220 RepID=UPI001296AA69